MQKQQNPDKLNNTTEILHIQDVNSKQSVAVSFVNIDKNVDHHCLSFHTSLTNSISRSVLS
jgi:hypothetical protein